jgi:hypothetical protein
LNKGESTDPVQRLGGSIGLPDAARSVLLLARDPDDPDGVDGSQRVLAQAKSNYGPRLVSEAKGGEDALGGDAWRASGHLFLPADLSMTGRRES